MKQTKKFGQFLSPYFVLTAVVLFCFMSQRCYLDSTRGVVPFGLCSEGTRSAYSAHGS